MNNQEQAAIIYDIETVLNNLIDTASSIHNNPEYITYDYLQGQYAGILESVIQIQNLKMTIINREVRK